MSSSPMRSVAEVLSGIMESPDSPLGHMYLLSKIHVSWAQWMPPLVAQNTQPISLRHGCLVVWVKNSVWMYELNLTKKTLLERINQHLGGQEIRDIRWTLQLPQQQSTET